MNNAPLSCWFWNGLGLAPTLLTTPSLSTLKRNIMASSGCFYSTNSIKLPIADSISLSKVRDSRSFYPLIYWVKLGFKQNAFDFSDDFILKGVQWD